MKSSSLESRLNGRLALLDETGSVERTIQESCLARTYGSRIAGLVGKGNTDAIDLVDLTESRAKYCNGSQIDINILEDYDHTIDVLCRRLGLPSDSSSDLTQMLRLASGGGYNSKRHFESNLTEGLILNVNTLASNVLAIPSGEYVVWATDAGHTMLVPTSEAKKPATADIMTDAGPEIQVHTKDLVGCWNKLERVIGETHTLTEREGRRWHKTSKSGVEGGGREPEVSKGSSGRPNLRRARLSTGKSLSDVSSATGWAIPTIAKAELYSDTDSGNPHAPSYEVIDDLVNFYGCDYKDAFRTGVVQPYAQTVQNTDKDEAGKKPSKPKETETDED